jgi:uncharacterized membrane protein YtjA (UPF0391 family)
MLGRNGLRSLEYADIGDFQTSHRGRERVIALLYWAVVFLIIAVVAGILGFGVIGGVAATIAEVLFVIFVILLVISLIFGLRGRH